MKKTLSILAFLTLAASLTFAQTLTSDSPHGNGNGVQRRVGFLTTLLTLTTAQQQQATTIFTNAATSAATVHTSMKTARETLKTAVSTNDTATIDATAASIGTLTGQLTGIEAKADAAFFQILTADQQTKFTQFESQGHGGMMGAGRTGPAGFRGGPR